MTLPRASTAMSQHVASSRRSCSWPRCDTYAGIRPADIAGFIAAQAAGAALGGLVFTWLVALPAAAARSS